MPVWRCPHCGIPQPESSRCWVCHRSTTLCGTCRHFRRGIATGFGVCGLDARRPVLRASELRPCWAATVREPSDADETTRARDAIPLVAAVPSGHGSSPGRTFVPVDEAADTGEGVTAPIAQAPAAQAAAIEAATGRAAATGAAEAADRWTLWSELDS